MKNFFGVESFGGDVGGFFDFQRRFGGSSPPRSEAENFEMLERRDHAGQ